MLSEISDQLVRVIEKKKLKEKTQQDLSQVEQRLQVKSGLLDTLERQLRQEQVDVDRLEGLSLKGLFYALLGSKEEQVDKERQDLLAAQLKHQAAKHDVDTLLAERERLQRQLEALRGVEDEYAALLASKESQLRRSGARASGELLRLSEQIAALNAQAREIGEAISAANGVLSSLDQVIGALESAEGWGTWDLLGGGFLSTAIKHSRIDEARAAVLETQDQMSRFTRELADVRRSASIQIAIDGLDTFADFFFDGLIMDWIVQSKIHNSLDQSRQARQKIAKAAQDLAQLQTNVTTQTETLRAQRASLVEGA